MSVVDMTCCGMVSDSSLSLHLATCSSLHRRISRAQGLCESSVLRGPREGQMCRAPARWLVKRYDLRLCGNHVRAYVERVEIGSEGWND